MLLSLASITFSVKAVGEMLNCATYSGGTKGFECNYRSDILCTEGCKSFVTASECTLGTYPKKPVTSELCTVAYGRDTARAHACITGQASFRCTGSVTGTGVCYGCVPLDQITWAN
ncbi:hypothetical protein PCANC_14337 [Puccinia coronata f. sp. avenae]|uniref:Secreted protein n=1 Tax=Puccinia coronata f. sp. avenae TaxID=200324 RepID=A0A2N5SR28_9BASI|nr:hypothetical protein PCANC_14337 [Puccinia coronata f. sp. avenae]